jgi:hypothetical protein
LILLLCCSGRNQWYQIILALQETERLDQQIERH